VWGKEGEREGWGGREAERGGNETGEGGDGAGDDDDEGGIDMAERRTNAIIRSLALSNHASKRSFSPCSVVRPHGPRYDPRRNPWLSSLHRKQSSYHIPSSSPPAGPAPHSDHPISPTLRPRRQGPHTPSRGTDRSSAACYTTGTCLGARHSGPESVRVVPATLVVVLRFTSRETS
jgi:hypothetical protein